MKRLLILPALAFVSACAADNSHVADPGERVVYQTVYKPVREPCPVKEPVAPSKLKRPLPTDLGALVDVLLAKLAEYDGAGKYVSQVHDGFAICTRPIPPNPPSVSAVPTKPK